MSHREDEALKTLANEINCAVLTAMHAGVSPAVVAATIGATHLRLADAMPLIEAASNALRLTPTTRGGGMLRSIEGPLAHIHNRGGA